MKPDELRNQAKRWRERAPLADKETAEALADAAGSLESLADEKDKKDGKPAPAPQPTEFIHRAYEPKKPA
jgi:hypothetical protein